VSTTCTGSLGESSPRTQSRMAEADPEVEASDAMTCVVAGARFDATVDGEPIEASQPFVVPAGGRLRFGARRRGARATLAVRGGITVPPIMGSRSTSIVSRMGPVSGRQLIAGDVLRGRYYKSWEKPEALPANQVVHYQIPFPANDHVFQRGHRIMVQIQSSWFPLYDRNPQTFVKSIFWAKPGHQGDSVSAADSSIKRALT